jgi:hypothetical protein
LHLREPKERAGHGRARPAYDARLRVGLATQDSTLEGNVVGRSSVGKGTCTDGTFDGSIHDDRRLAIDISVVHVSARDRDANSFSHATGGVLRLWLPGAALSAVGIR